MAFNLNNDLTETDVAEMLASVPDVGTHRIIVSREGDVSLVEVPDQQPRLSDLHCYFETYVGGNGYVGTEAAADQNHVRGIASDLRANWPSLVGDEFIDH